MAIVSDLDWILDGSSLPTQGLSPDQSIEMPPGEAPFSSSTRSFHESAFVKIAAKRTGISGLAIVLRVLMNRSHLVIQNGLAIWTLALAVLFGALLSPVEVSAQPVTVAGLTYEWSFDDGGGVVADDSADSNDATLQSFAAGNAQWVTGVYGGALNFTSTSSYAITAAPISSSQFTISFWSRHNGNLTASDNDSVLFTPQGASWITNNRSGGKGIGIGNVRDSIEPIPGVWEHYAVAVNRLAGTASVYRDGVLRASGAVSLAALDNKWVFAHEQNPSNNSFSWKGALDEVQLYSSVLSASEIAQLAARPLQPNLTSHLVAAAQSFGSVPTGQYATASTSFFVDPSRTDWIAWNRYPDLRAASESRPGQLLLGALTPEVDDFFNLTITNPLGQQMTVAMDRNGGFGEPMFQQSVIFGTSAAAPDVARGNNLASPSFLNESGAFNSLFSVAGNYSFNFSFQNIGGDGRYPAVYLLVHTVPEPSAFLSASLGFVLLILASASRRRRRYCLLKRASRTRRCAPLSRRRRSWR